MDNSLGSLFDEVEGVSSPEKHTEYGSLFDEVERQEPNDIPAVKPKQDNRLSNVEDATYNIPEDISTDNDVTKPTEVALGKEDFLDNPEYHSDQYYDEQTAKLVNQKAEEGGGIITDPKTGQDIMVDEKGLEDSSMDIAMGLPVGKLSIFTELPTNVSSKLITKGKLTKQAELLLRLNQGRISEEEAIKLLKDIPKKDQVISLAESLDLAKNYFGRAVGDDSRLATKLGKRLEARHQVIKPFIADEDEVKLAKKAYGNMKQELDTVSDKVYPTENIQNAITDKLIDTYATDPSGISSSLKRIKLDTENPITPSQALDIRENINELLRKPSVKKSFKTTEALRNIKDSLDNFLDTTVPSEFRTKMKQVTMQYKETMNRQRLGEIIYKHTKSDFATDWDKVLSDVKKEKLGGKNTEFVVPILKEFTKKFHNDKYLSEAITPMGDSKNLSWLGVFSYIIGKTYDLAAPIINRSRYKDNILKKSIIKSIKRLDTTSPVKFVDELVKDKVIDLEQANIIKKELLKPEYKGNQGSTIIDGEVGPLYATEKGTVGKDASEISLHDRQRGILDNVLKNPNQSNKVMDRLDKIGFFDKGFKRYENIIKSTRTRLKTDDINHNIQVVKNVITNEAKQLIKVIEKTEGIKLPQEEAEKIIKYKLDDMFKDCE